MIPNKHKKQKKQVKVRNGQKKLRSYQLANSFQDFSFARKEYLCFKDKEVDNGGQEISQSQPEQCSTLKSDAENSYQNVESNQNTNYGQEKLCLQNFISRETLINNNPYHSFNQNMIYINEGIFKRSPSNKLLPYFNNKYQICLGQGNTHKSISDDHLHILTKNSLILQTMLQGINKQIKIQQKIQKNKQILQKAQLQFERKRKLQQIQYQNICSSKKSNKSKMKVQYAYNFCKEAKYFKPTLATVATIKQRTNYKLSYLIEAINIHNNTVLLQKQGDCQIGYINPYNKKTITILSQLISKQLNKVIYYQIQQLTIYDSRQQLFIKLICYIQPASLLILDSQNYKIQYTKLQNTKITNLKIAKQNIQIKWNKTIDIAQLYAQHDCNIQKYVVINKWDVILHQGFNHQVWVILTNMQLKQYNIDGFYQFLVVNCQNLLKYQPKEVYYDEVVNTGIIYLYKKQS